MAMNEVCQEIREMLPAYAVGALEEGERAYVLEHLDDCPDCLRELRQYEQVAEGMLHAVPPLAPPPGLRDRLAASVSGAGAREGSEAPRPVFPLLRYATAAGVTALLIVNVMLLFRVRDLAAGQTDLNARLERNQTGLALGAYSTSRVAEIDSEEVFGTVVYDPNQPLAIIYVWGLDPLPPERAYQVWLREESGGRTSGGLFRADSDARFTVAVAESPQDLRTFVGLGVTVEPAGGSPGPSGPPVFTASLR